MCGIPGSRFMTFCECRVTGSCLIVRAITGQYGSQALGECDSFWPSEVFQTASAFSQPAFSRMKLQRTNICIISPAAGLKVWRIISNTSSVLDVGDAVSFHIVKNVASATLKSISRSPRAIGLPVGSYRLRMDPLLE